MDLMSSHHEWLQIQVHGWDVMWRWTWLTRRAYARRFVHEKMNKECTQGDLFKNEINKEHMQGDLFTNGQTHGACLVQTKERHAHSNIKRTQRPLNASHISPCGSESMIHQENIHHSAALQPNMHTTSNMNIPSLSCRVMSWVISATSLLWATLL